MKKRLGITNPETAKQDLIRNLPYLTENFKTSFLTDSLDLDTTNITSMTQMLSNSDYYKNVDHFPLLREAAISEFM